MAKKKMDSQGEIIGEVRRARAQVGREFKANRKKFFERARRSAQELGMHYGTPRKRKKKNVA